MALVLESHFSSSRKTVLLLLFPSTSAHKYIFFCQYVYFSVLSLIVKKTFVGLEENRCYVVIVYAVENA